MGIVRYITKADTLLEVAWRWVPLFGVAWTAFGWLAQRVTWFGQLNWAEAAFAGLGVTMLLSVVTSVALIAIRIFRPVSAPNTEAGSIGDSGPAQPEVDVAAELNRLDAKIRELCAEAASRESRANGKLMELEGAFSTVLQKVDKHIRLLPALDEVKRIAARVLVKPDHWDDDRRKPDSEGMRALEDAHRELVKVLVRDFHEHSLDRKLASGLLYRVHDKAVSEKGRKMWELKFLNDGYVAAAESHL